MFETPINDIIYPPISYIISPPLTIEDEMKRIVDVCNKNEVVSKVIFETCYLTNEEKRILCDVAMKVKPTFIKTSTGFGTAGATLEDIKLMKEYVEDKIKIKASGGIRSLEDMLAMVDAGASRIGTSSGVKIIEDFKKQNSLEGE